MGRGLEAAVRAPSTYVIVFLIGLILASFSEMPASVDVPVHVTLSSWDISKSGRGRAEESRLPTPVWVGLIQSLEGLNRTKKLCKREPQWPDCLSGTSIISCFQTCTRTDTISSPGPQSFGPRLEVHHQLPQVSSLLTQIRRLLSLVATFTKAQNLGTYVRTMSWLSLTAFHTTPNIGVKNNSYFVMCGGPMGQGMDSTCRGDLSAPQCLGPHGKT
ncbi:uncharacterized protein LOC120588127 [Pteropus medius]|uniref:uncharacterized protein LOC120588127 n=1 Tax=Pteropus vampyrus TaxID=132908 RepID=UPI00196A30A6|nr:uncharacterized protein LOC120588127 [Pteropus giganteus]